MIHFVKHYLFLTLLLKAARVSGKLIYIPSFIGIGCCKDYENNEVDLKDLHLDTEYNEETEKKGVGLTGNASLTIKIDDTFQLSISVKKDTEGGQEPVFSVKASICGSLKEDDAPWHPIVEHMNLEGCPIEPAIFGLKNIRISLDPFEDCLTRDFCGVYEIELRFEKQTEVIACYILVIQIDEMEVAD